MTAGGQSYAELVRAAKVYLEKLRTKRELKEAGTKIVEERATMLAEHV
jgi:hypothetical protein